MITAIFSALVAALPSYAPLLVQVGLWLLNLWVTDSNQRAQNTTDFLNAIAAHVNDGLASVQERQNAWQQIQDLRAQAAAIDAKNGAPAHIKTQTAAHVQAELVWKYGPNVKGPVGPGNTPPSKPN